VPTFRVIIAQAHILISTAKVSAASARKGKIDNILLKILCGSTGSGNLMKYAKGMHEEHKRSVLKAISWRVIATSTGMSLVYLFTGKMELVAGFGIGDILLKFFFYIIHERAWNKVAFGRTIRGTVESAVRSPPVTASPLETISGIIMKMVSSDIGAVIVVDDNKPLGLITEGDIHERVVNAGKAPSKTFAKEIMSTPVATIRHDESLINMLRMMRDRQIRRLVVTKNGKVAGIITERRILESLV
jgi:CBS domain-containing protein